MVKFCQFKGFIFASSVQRGSGDIRSLLLPFFLFCVAFFSVIGLRFFLTKADVADFYPTACLGTWQNSQNAQGTPENLSIGFASSTFNASNSAIFSVPSTQIFCGGFLPSNFKTTGVIDRVGITFIWNVVGGSETTTSSVSTKLASGTLPSAPNIVQTVSSTNLSTSSGNSTISASTTASYLWWPISVAFADTTSSVVSADTTTITTDVSPAPIAQASSSGNATTTSSASTASSRVSVSKNATSTTSSLEIATATLAPASTTVSSLTIPTIISPTPPVVSTTATHSSPSIILGPPLRVDLSALTTSTTMNATATVSLGSSTISQATGTASTTPSLQNISTPDQNFLEISYSTDGVNWTELAKINPLNWQNFTISLPISNWNDLKNLQIKISSIPTSLTQVPTVYLDGMFVEAEYQTAPAETNLPLIGLPQETTSTSTNSNGNSSPSQSVIILPSQDAPSPAGGNANFNANEAPTFDFNLNALPAPPAITTTTSSTIIVSSTASTTLSSTTSTTSSVLSTVPMPTPVPVSSSTASSTSFLSDINHTIAMAGNFFLKILPFDNSAFAQTATPQITNMGLPTATNPVVAEIFNSENQQTNLQPTFVLAGGNLQISLPKPGKEFRPGAYSLRLWVWQNGTVYYSDSSFNWGVLVVNFDKSIYTLGDTVRIGFGVLTNQGHTVCDASIDAVITSPSGHVYHLSTKDKTITRNATCGPQTVSNDPDYSAIMQAKEVGTYTVAVTAQTSDGQRTINDSFDVQTLPLFDVSRSAPTRIYPPATYQVTIHIKANQDFNGDITETVPYAFQVIPQTFASRTFSGDSQILSWSVDLKKGNSIDLTYSFLAPDISPELYKLGPLQIGSWKEMRQWQIAADANWYGNWLYRQAITINASEVGSTTLSNFPVLINMTSTNLKFSGSGGDVQNANGSDILFTASDGTTKLNHQIENYSSSTGNLVAWVNVPSVATGTSTVFYMYYGNSTTTNEQNVTGTWDNNYQAVWHFPNGTILNASDSTAYANNGTINGATATAGEIDGGVNFNGSSDITTPYLQNQVTAYTIESWIKTSDSSSIQPIVNDRGSGAGKSLTLFLEGNGACGGGGCGGSAGVPSIGIDSNSIFIGLNGSTALTNGVWHQVVGTWAAASGTAVAPSQFTLYVDGKNINAAAETLAGSATSPLTGLGGAVIGYHQAWNHYFTGSMDEVRISTVARSASWIYTEYNNQSSPSTFYTVGTQETEPINNPTVTNVVLNNTNPIVLTPNATTLVSVSASTTAGTNALLYATSTIYRTGVGSNCVANNLNCYQIPSSSCIFSGASTTVTCSANIWYFAQATDASSSFPSDSWSGAIAVTDAASNVATGTSGVVPLNTMLAINVSPSNVSYGTLIPNTNTGSVNQTTTIQNVGNSSSTLKISGTAFILGSSTIATSSQHYATTTFTFGGLEQSLSDIPTAVSGFTLTAPTSTSSVNGNIFWGDQVPFGISTGTYTATTTFTAVFSP